MKIRNLKFVLYALYQYSEQINGNVKCDI